MIGYARSIAVLLVLISTARDSAGQPSVSVEDARKLVLLALPQATSRLPGLHLDEHNDPHFPAFFFFEVLWNNPNPGSVVAGHYAVDRKTGAVWETMSCRLITSPTIKKQQRVIRRRIGLTEQEYFSIRSKAPCDQTNTGPLSRPSPRD